MVTYDHDVFVALAGRHREPACLVGVNLAGDGNHFGVHQVGLDGRLLSGGRRRHDGGGCG